MINLLSGDVTKYLLENYKTVESIKNDVSKINIIETCINKIPFSMHWILCDKNGGCAIIEVKNKTVVFYENPYHVITNSPEFPQHVKNLQRFTFLSPYNKKNSLSEGTGALGLPGDNSSQSRFIRAHFYRENLPIQKNSEQGMQLLFRILHNFDIPLGSVIDKKSNEKEITEYTVCYNLNKDNMRYANYGYVRGKDNNWVQTSIPVIQCYNTDNILVFCLFLLFCAILYKNKYL